MITAAQKKILVKATVIILSFLGVWFVIYLPAGDRVKKIKLQLAELENSIKEIEASIGKTPIRGEDIKLLLDRLQEINSKFPEKEEGALKILSELAHKPNIELISIKVTGRRPLLDEGSKPLVVEGKACQVLSISIEMKCLYEDLVKYLEALKKEPIFITIEKFDLLKDITTGTGRLNVTLDINLYLLCRV